MSNFLGHTVRSSKQCLIERWQIFLNLWKSERLTFSSFLICYPDLLEIRYHLYVTMTKCFKRQRRMKIFPSCFILIFGYFPWVTNISYFVLTILKSFNDHQYRYGWGDFCPCFIPRCWSQFIEVLFPMVDQNVHLKSTPQSTRFFRFFFLVIFSINISSIILSISQWVVVYNIHSCNILSAKYNCRATVCHVESPFFKRWWSYKSMACMKVLQKFLVFSGWVHAVFQVLKDFLIKRSA